VSCGSRRDESGAARLMCDCVGVAHASFLHSRVEEDAQPRESIELRAFVFFGMGRA
jgi:hypothetical protein